MISAEPGNGQRRTRMQPSTAIRTEGRSFMAPARFTMIVLITDDLARSVGFYRHLGVDFPADAEQRSDVQVPLGESHQLVISTTFAARYDPDRRPPSGGSRIELEFFVDGRAAVDAMWEELLGAGYHGRRAPFLTGFDAYMCLVDDPDGNTVLVTAG